MVTIVRCVCPRCGHVLHQHLEHDAHEHDGLRHERTTYAYCHACRKELQLGDVPVGGAMTK